VISTLRAGRMYWTTIMQGGFMFTRALGDTVYIVNAVKKSGVSENPSMASVNCGFG